jgi:hypothetical protein
LALRGTAGPADKRSAVRRVTGTPDKREMAKKLEQELLG